MVQNASKTFIGYLRGALGFSLDTIGKEETE